MKESDSIFLDGEELGPRMKSWCPLGGISYFALGAIVAAEDSRFYEHSGVDFRAMEHSFKENWKLKRYAFGASTITQQVVRLAFLTQEKHILRKIREILGALILERFLKKGEILEWYINLAYFGQGSRGLAKASQHYFRTNVECLTAAQSIHLALLLPAPSIRGEQLFHEKKMSSNFKKKFEIISKQMLDQGVLTDFQWKEVMLTGNFGAPIHGEEEAP